MGRKPKEWSLFELIDLFESKVDRCMTYHDLSRVLNGNKYPKRLDFCIMIMRASGYFLFRPCDPKRQNDKKEICYMPAYREAAEREFSEPKQADTEPKTPAGTSTNGSN